MTELLTELAPSLQKLVDSRLDNIDRALLSSEVSRYERRQIVCAVEDQIQELVARIEKDEPTREDILRILASLDPPEAYGTGSLQSTNDPSAERATMRFASSQSGVRKEPKGNILAIVSVALGAMSVIVLPSFIVISVYAFLFSAAFSLAAMICGIIALCQLVNYSGTTIGRVMSILGILSFPCGSAITLLFLLVASM